MRIITQMLTGQGLENIPGVEKTEETEAWENIKEGFKTWYTK